MSDNLHDCSECGSSDIRVIHKRWEGMPDSVQHIGQRFYVECQKCLKATLKNGFSTSESAITVWNKINPQSPPGTLDVDTLLREFRSTFECMVCSNTPNDDGELEHGRGCYVVDSDGGGSTYEDNTDRAAIVWMLEHFNCVAKTE